ncbi:sigma-70 family RNA polymerase sigma factor [Fontivita pretiosa]|uniref:sigma-70 family RNA polymerase sigma factor n=1 Tax=Fontivita pretiosa TaxID=2989684 RepID=UPI003D1636C8
MSSLSGAQYEADLPPRASGGELSGVAPLPAGQALAGAASPGDGELFRLAQQGDRAAFGQIVVRFQHRLYNAILRMVGDPEEARELAQETFTRALVKIDSFRGEAQPYTWLFRIAMNLAISQLRKVQRHRTFSLDGGGGVERDNGRLGRGGAAGEDPTRLLDRLADDADDAAQNVQKSELHQQVLAALGRLDAEYRAVLVMRDIEGFDYQQMAEVLNLPLGTLKSRLFRARLALRDELKSYMK